MVVELTDWPGDLSHILSVHAQCAREGHQLRLDTGGIEVGKSRAKVCVALRDDGPRRHRVQDIPSELIGGNVGPAGALPEVFDEPAIIMRMHVDRHAGSPRGTGPQCDRIRRRKALARSDCGARKNSSGGATSTISPASMKTMRSATRRAKPISCVTQIIVIP